MDAGLYGLAAAAAVLGGADRARVELGDTGGLGYPLSGSVAPHSHLPEPLRVLVGVDRGGGDDEFRGPSFDAGVLQPGVQPNEVC